MSLPKRKKSDEETTSAKCRFTLLIKIGVDMEEDNPFIIPSNTEMAQLCRTLDWSKTALGKKANRAKFF